MTEYELKKHLLFIPLETKEALHNWIQVYLGLNLPTSIVDENSTSCPMDALWEVYDRCRRNKEDEFSRILNFASRMSFKTLNTAILETLMVFHLGRSVSHMAAIKSQSDKAQQYVKKFLRRPILRDFIVGDNEKKVQIVRYVNKEEDITLAPKEWEALSGVEKDKYDCIDHYIEIVILTMTGANSSHSPFCCLDEVEIVPNLAAYEEAKAIPDTFQGKIPVTLLTSTRKFGYGLVQKEIDNAKDTGLEVRHWNIIDVTEKCPETRHRPDLPKLTIYRSDEELKSVSEEEYKGMLPNKQDLYVKDEGFAGCLSNCKLFAVCKTRLVTHQKSDSPLLKPIAQVQTQFRHMNADMAKAQLLCLKPSSEGLIYPRLDRELHMISAAQMAEKIIGRKMPETFNKKQLIALANNRNIRYYMGVDWGFTHCFAGVLGFKDGNRMFIFDAFAIPELDISQMFNVFESRIKPYDPIIYPDTAYPAYIKEFRKRGYKMMKWDKYAGSVVGGIESVRMKLNPVVGEPELFILEGDDGCELLFKTLSQYHWKLDAAGEPTDEPDETEDDLPDAHRYLVQNVFGAGGKVVATKNNEFKKKQIAEETNPNANWMQKEIEDRIESTDTDGAFTPVRGKKGGLIYDL